jgi:hypothetical protein
MMQFLEPDAGAESDVPGARGSGEQVYLKARIMPKVDSAYNLPLNPTPTQEHPK